MISTKSAFFRTVAIDAPLISASLNRKKLSRVNFDRGDPENEVENCDPLSFLDRC